MEIVNESLAVPGPSSREGFLDPSYPEDFVWDSIRKEDTFPLSSGLRITEAVLRAAEAWSPGIPDSGTSHTVKNKADSRLKKADEGARAVERRLRELTRERKDILHALEQLEVGAARNAGLTLAEKIAKAELPDSRDLAALDFLIRELRLAAEQERLVEELEKRNRAMENVLSQTKDIVASSPWFQEAITRLPQTEKKKIHFHDVAEMKLFHYFDEPREVRRTKAVSFPTHSEENMKKLPNEMKKEEESIPVQLSMLLEEAIETLSEAEKDVSVSSTDVEKYSIKENTTKNEQKERKRAETMTSLDDGRELNDKENIFLKTTGINELNPMEEEPMVDLDVIYRNNLAKFFEQFEIIKEPSGKLNKLSPQLSPQNEESARTVNFYKDINEECDVCLVPKYIEENTKILEVQNEKHNKERKTVNHELEEHKKNFEKNTETDRKQKLETESCEIENKKGVFEEIQVDLNKENTEIQLPNNEENGKEDLIAIKEVAKPEELGIIKEVQISRILEDSRDSRSSTENELNLNIFQPDGLSIQKSVIWKEENKKMKASKAEKEPERKHLLSKMSKEKQHNNFTERKPSTSHDFTPENNVHSFPQQIGTDICNPNQENHKLSSETVGLTDKEEYSILTKYRTTHLPSIVLVDIEEEISKISEIEMQEYAKEQRVLQEEGKSQEIQPKTRDLTHWMVQETIVTPNEQSNGVQEMDALRYNPQPGSSQLEIDVAMDSQFLDFSRSSSDDGNYFENKSDSDKNK